MKTNSTTLTLRSHPRTGLQQTINALPYLLDAETGLIQSIEWFQPRHNEPQLIHCHAMLADIGRLTGRICNRGTGGTALSKDLALAKAIGESVERYCSDLFNEAEVSFASYAKIKSRASDPRRFALFHSNQYRSRGFPFQELREDTVIGWVEGFSLTRQAVTLVPATMVHVGYQPPAMEQNFDQTPVSGYACGNTIEEALLGGLLEVIERDALMVCWYNRLAVPAFDLRLAESVALRQTLDRYHCAPVKLHCASLTTDLGIPVALAAMTSTAPGWPATVVAMAAHLDAEQAIARAFQELAANHLYVRHLFEDQRQRRPRSPNEVLTQEDHGLFYCSPERWPALDAVLRPRRFVRARDQSLPVSDDVKENLDFCVRRLAECGFEVIAVDITSDDVAALGFHVFKVLVPGLQPIDFGAGLPHLGGRRLYEAPVRMGYRRTPPHPHQLNYFPHPFP